MAEPLLVGRDEVFETVSRTLLGGRNVLLTGPAGIGKSFLMHAVTRAIASRVHVESVTATPAMRTIPFGSFHAMLATEHHSQTAILQAVGDELRDRASGRRLVVAVDDAHLLDDASVACVTDLVRQDVTIVLTVRTGEPMPPTLTGLWTSGSVERVDVQRLSDDAVATLTESRLDGPIDDELRAAVVSAAQGIPLLLRELLVDAITDGVVAREDGVWRATRPLRAGGRLIDLISARTAQLAPSVREVLELVSLTEPVDTSLLDASGPELDELESRGFVRFEPDGDRLMTRCDHPLVAEAVRGSTTLRRRRKHIATMARKAMASTAKRPGDALRAAEWSRAADLELPADLAAMAATDALDLMELDLAADLARTSLAMEQTWRPTYVLANVQRLRGNVELADETFERAAVLASGDHAIASTAERHGWLHAHHRGDSARAVEVISAAARRVIDPSLRFQLEQSAANFAGMYTGYHEVRRRNQSLLADDSLPEGQRRSARRNWAYASLLVGAVGGLDDELEKQLGWGETPDVEDMLWGMRAAGAIHRGDLAGGAALVGDCFRARSCAEEPVGSTGSMLGVLLHLAGSPRAFDVLELTGRALQEIDPFGILIRHHAIAAAALSDADRHEGAASILDALPERVDDPRAVAFVGRAIAAGAAATGDLERAANLTADAGRASIDLTQTAFGVLALHGAVRYGHADAVVAELRGAVEDPAARLLRVLVADAEVSADGDGKALAAIAEDLVACGATLLAADAAGRACRLVDQDTAHARRLAARARVLARATEPFRSPTHEVENPLTDRELDVALAAATGRTSKEIAEELFISVRTVDNHLRNVYAKLEVGGRDGLAEVLAPPDSTGCSSAPAMEMAAAVTR